MEWAKLKDRLAAILRIRYMLYKRYRFNKKHGLTWSQSKLREKLISACCKIDENCDARIKKTWYGWKIEVYSE
jgi:hypothetical protein